MENPAGANDAILTSTLSSEKPGWKCKRDIKLVAIAKRLGECLQ